MNDGQTTPDMLRDVQREIPDVIESLGELTACLREAISDTESGNLKGAWIVASDALDAFAALEQRLSGMSVTVAKWIGGEE